jgi:hypothetical protein
MRNVLRPHRVQSSPPAVVVMSSAAPTDVCSLAGLVAHAFERAGIRSRALIVGRLLASTGPLALAVVGGGVFARHLCRGNDGALCVSPEEAASLRGADVYELARYVEQSDPKGFAALVDGLGAVLHGRAGLSVTAVL